MSDSAGAGEGRPDSHKGSMLLSLSLMVVLDIGLSILVFFVARSQGASQTVAYLVASAGPFAGMLANWLRTRKFGGVSIVILVFILVSALVSLVGSNDAKVLLLKDSAITGGFGILTLLSAIRIFPKPLMFFFGLKFATDGTRAGIDTWYELWRKYPTFRSGQYLVNTVWGVSFLLEAVVKAACTMTLPYDTAYTISQVFPFAVLAAVLTWTIRFGKRQRQQAGNTRHGADTQDRLPPTSGHATPT